jgi:hypothetical protein
MSTTSEVSDKKNRAKQVDSMKLRDAWKLSKLPYGELVYKSSELVSGYCEKDLKHVRATLIAAKANKARFTIFVCLGAALPFVGFVINPTPISLVSAITLSLVMSFAYLVLYSLQILPSFSNAEAYSLLLTLPLSEQAFSEVTMLSFVRTFDYLAIGSVLVPFGLSHS